MQKWLILAVSLLAVPTFAHDRDRDRDPCNSRALRNRSAEEVLEAHRAALAAGDYASARCNYAEDAVVVNDGGTTTGRDNIIAELQALGGLFGGIIPIVNQEVIVSILNDRAEMARVLFSITTTCVDIPDGVDTYIIKNGKIQAQTAHGFPVFKCAP